VCLSEGPSNWRVSYRRASPIDYRIGVSLTGVPLTGVPLTGVPLTGMPLTGVSDGGDDRIL
jgi:hypothetical protein